MQLLFFITIINKIRDCHNSCRHIRKHICGELQSKRERERRKKNTYAITRLKGNHLAEIKRKKIKCCKSILLRLLIYSPSKKSLSLNFIINFCRLNFLTLLFNLIDYKKN